MGTRVAPPLSRLCTYAIPLCSHDRAAIVWLLATQAVPRAFVWNGTNYLTTLPSSLDFLNRVTRVVSFFGFHLLRNPFVVPLESVPLDALPPHSANHVRRSNMQLVREAEQLILEEER